ncbi:hypothetical protein OsJ_20001 [Oryza sativa Japonica Group]|uniref:Uncharacterized protein n=1 Tax=Oryza sativa subsp. japonica TaxID=39947 RepID=B9FRB6_ORYSJ|nr:hypothetical protein OsJ_20001 [Oryza sativa Japonica Group]
MSLVKSTCSTCCTQSGLISATGDIESQSTVTEERELGTCCKGPNIMAIAGQESSQVELWDIDNAIKVMCLPETGSANLADHPTKQRGSSPQLLL